MSFFNYDDTFSQYHISQLEHPHNNNRLLDDNDTSFESEAEFLKSKLIQTHRKLLIQLENSKSLQSQLQRSSMKVQHLYQQNQSLKTKASSLNHKVEKEKVSNHQARILETKLVKRQAIQDDTEKKNDLLRVDLDSMRSKMLEIMMQKTHFQQQYEEMSQKLQILQQQNKLLKQTSRILESQLSSQSTQLQILKKKHQKCLSDNQSISEQYTHLKQQVSEKQTKISQIQQQLKQEREKTHRSLVQLQNSTVQFRQLKAKFEKTEEASERLKEQIYNLESRGRNQGKVNCQLLEKTTAQLNQMTVLYKQKQRELQQLRRKPAQQAHRKRQHFENVKELVSKLQGQQNTYKKDRQQSRQSPQKHQSKTPIKSYKQQKQQYIDMISQVSQMQSELLQFNLQKKKLTSELDRIDNTKIKTKELIARRRKLQNEINCVEHSIDGVKLQLRKLKVI